MAVITYREALNQAHREEMRRDGRVFLIGEEVAEYEGAYKVSQGLLKEFGPKRVVDTPIAEEVIVGVAVGAAMAGLRPIAEMMTINFSLLAMDQIVNHAAKLRYMSGGQLTIPLVIRAPQGGGQQLGAQHSQSLEAWYVHVPGLKVVTASAPADAKGLLKSAIRDDNPVLFLEHEVLYNHKGEVPDGEYTTPLGVAEVKRAGEHVTIVAYLRMVEVALAAAERLAQEGIEAEVIDPRTLKPLDIETIAASVKKTNRAVIVEECWRTCGMAAEIQCRIHERAFDYLDAPVARVSGADVPMPYASHLEQLAIPDEEAVIAAVKGVVT
jgi:pyruvate dehydrogenase E1 component beta subunit